MSAKTIDTAGHLGAPLVTSTTGPVFPALRLTLQLIRNNELATRFLPRSVMVADVMTAWGDELV